MKELQVRLIPMTTIGLLLLTFVAVASALPHALISNKIDKCPDFEPMSNFNLGRFLGGWYEIERYPMIYEVLTSCVWTNYTAVGSDQMGKIYMFLVKSIFIITKAVRGYEQNEIKSRFESIHRADTY